MREALPGFSGGKLSGRSRAEAGREGDEEEEEVNQMENEVMSAILAKELREMEVAEGDVTWKVASVAQSTEAGQGTSGKSEFEVNRKDLLEGTSRSMSQSVDCSQVEDDLEEREAMGRGERGRRKDNVEEK